MALALYRMLTTRLPGRQCAALPLLRDAEGQLLVGLATSRDTGRWVLPKGWEKAGKPVHKTAEDEAREEAGLLGEIETVSVGSYRYRKRLHIFASLMCEVQVFVLHVDRQLVDWPEKHQRREVAFVSPEQAAERVRERGLSKLILSVAKARQATA